MYTINVDWLNQNYPSVERHAVTSNAEAAHHTVSAAQPPCAHRFRAARCRAARGRRDYWECRRRRCGKFHERRKKSAPPAGTADENPVPPVERPDHFLDWLQCIRSGGTPHASIEAGYQHAVAVLMAAKSFETGRKVVYDSKKRKIRTI